MGVLAWLFFAFLFGTVFWVGGRIILPEMSLTAPPFWAWFWFSGIVMNFLLWFALVLGSDTRRYRSWF